MNHEGESTIHFQRLVFFSVLLTVLLLGACGNEGKEKAEKVDSKTTTTEEKGETTKEDDPADKEDKDHSGEILNSHVEEDTGGDVEVVFTNNNPELTHSFSDDVTFTIDQYQIVHVSNMNESAKVDFKDEDEGYVITFQVTLDNQSDEDVYFAGGYTFLSDDATDHLMKKRHFVDRDEWLRDETTESASQYSKGTFTGLEAYALTKAQFKNLEAPTLKVDALWLNDDPSQRLGEEALFVVPVNEAGTEKAEATSTLYADRMVTDSIADKEIFFESADIDETKEIDAVKVTLDGVQYANITPTEGHKPRFSNFGDGGIVALTAKFTVENGSDIPFDKSFIGKKLRIDDNRGTLLSEGMLEPIMRGSFEPGDKEEVLAVFLFREDEFQIYKKLELEFGPLAGEDAKKLFKEKSATFDLPMKE